MAGALVGIVCLLAAVGAGVALCRRHAQRDTATLGGLPATTPNPMFLGPAAFSDVGSWAAAAAAEDEEGCKDEDEDEDAYATFDSAAHAAPADTYSGYSAGTSAPQPGSTYSGYAAPDVDPPASESPASYYVAADIEATREFAEAEHMVYVAGPGAVYAVPAPASAGVDEDDMYAGYSAAQRGGDATYATVAGDKSTAVQNKPLPGTHAAPVHKFKRSDSFC